MFVVCPKCSAKYKIPDDIVLKSGQKLQCSACQHTFYFTDDVNLAEKVEGVRGIQNPPPEIPQISQIDESNLVPSTQVSQTLPEAFRPLEPVKKSVFAPVWVILSFILLVGVAYLAWQYKDLLQPTVVRHQPLPRPSVPKVAVNVVPNVEQEPAISSSVPDVALVESEIVAEQSVALSEPAVISEVDDVEQEVAAPLSQPEISTIEEPSIKTETITKSEPSFSFQSVHFRLVPKTDGDDSMLIEGFIQNDTQQGQKLPAVLVATAYDAHGAVIFTKDIFLSSGLIDPMARLPFFGTYAPAPKDVQWIDVTVKQ